MKRNKEKIKPEIVVPAGYDLTEIMDTDDSGYDFEDAILYEEVGIEYERNERTE